jgi:hypothetical protein
MVCLVVGLDTIGLNLTYLIMLSIHDKEWASPGICSLIMYIDVFSSLLGRVTTEGFLSRILICLTIGHVLLQVSLPSNKKWNIMTCFLEFVHYYGHPAFVFGGFKRMKMQTKFKQQNICPISHNGADDGFGVSQWLVLEKVIEGHIMIPLSRYSYLDSVNWLYIHYKAVQDVCLLYR